MKSGQGTLYWPDGSCYIGSFKHGKIEGSGKKIWKSGKVYEGSWVNEREHGCGKLTNPNGSVYEGLFSNGLKHGIGKLTLYLPLSFLELMVTHMKRIGWIMNRMENLCWKG